MRSPPAGGGPGWNRRGRARSPRRPAARPMRVGAALGAAGPSRTLRLTVSQTRRRFSTASESISASRSSAPVGCVRVTAALGDEHVVQAPCGGRVSEHRAPGTDEQVEHRSLRSRGVIRRGWKQPRGVPLDEVEGELADPFQLREHAHQRSGVIVCARVRIRRERPARLDACSRGNQSRPARMAAASRVWPAATCFACLNEPRLLHQPVEPANVVEVLRVQIPLSLNVSRDLVPSGLGQISAVEEPIQQVVQF